tara:strand:+ start:1093 stop:1215 length:123 start_codon:yes stop_codon:yes gene_type:complete
MWPSASAIRKATKSAIVPARMILEEEAVMALGVLTSTLHV